MRAGATPKDKLFQTAARLFFQQGYRAIGVDTIAAESGVGKMTLYRHFPSKDDLIVAFLEDSDTDFWAHFDGSTASASTARDKLIAFFRSLQDYVMSPTCYGCPFIHVAAEFPETTHPAHQLALRHKQAVRARFAALARETRARRPDALADSLLLLMDGAYVAARLYGASPKSPASHLADAAARLIAAHCEP